jgi:hypothetical protein
MVADFCVWPAQPAGPRRTTVLQSMPVGRTETHVLVITVDEVVVIGAGSGDARVLPRTSPFPSPTTTMKVTRTTRLRIPPCYRDCAREADRAGRSTRLMSSCQRVVGRFRPSAAPFEQPHDLFVAPTDTTQAGICDPSIACLVAPVIQPLPWGRLVRGDHFRSDTDRHRHPRPDGNAVANFVGSSCAPGDLLVTADLTVGTHDTFSTTYTIKPPAVTDI